MDNKKDDEYYISQVIENIDATISYSEGQQYDEFTKDGKSIDASARYDVEIQSNHNRVGGIEAFIQYFPFKAKDISRIRG